LVTQVVLAVYLQVVEWIPLGRWNNVAKGNGQEGLDVVVALLQVVILFFYWKVWRWPMVAGLAAYAYWLYTEITWVWVSYFRGASPEAMHEYEHWFANTYKFLPQIDGHPVPDAEHTVLLLLLLLVLIFSVREVWKAFSKP
jgi:hypothetical protein